MSPGVGVALAGVATADDVDVKRRMWGVIRAVAPVLNTRTFTIVDVSAVPRTDKILAALARHPCRRWKMPHVAIPRDLGPVLGEHGSAPRVNFHLPAKLKPRALEAEIKPADAGEERPDRQGFHNRSLSDLGRFFAVKMYVKTPRPGTGEYRIAATVSASGRL